MKMQTSTPKPIFQAGPDKIRKNASGAIEKAQNASQRYRDQELPVTISNNAPGGVATHNASAVEVTTTKAATMKALALAHLMPLDLSSKGAQYASPDVRSCYVPFACSEEEFKAFEDALIADMAGCDFTDSAEVSDRLMGVMEQEISFVHSTDNMQVDHALQDHLSYAAAADGCYPSETSLPLFLNEYECDEIYKSESDIPLPDWYMDPSDDVVQTFTAMLVEMEATDRKSPHKLSATKQKKKTPSLCSVSPFNDETYKADLIHCPTVDLSKDIDMLDFYAKEYVRSLRLLRTRKRWSSMGIWDWILETKTIAKAITNPDNSLQLWQPLSEWFNLYHRAMVEACKTTRTKYKHMLLKELERVAKMKVTENRAALVDLLEARKQVMAQGAWKWAKRAVSEECDRVGSLSLGSVPEFTNDVRMGMSHTWAWVD